MLTSTTVLQYSWLGYAIGADAHKLTSVRPPGLLKKRISRKETREERSLGSTPSAIVLSIRRTDNKKLRARLRSN